MKKQMKNYLDSHSFNLILNEVLPNIDLLTQILSKNNIPFKIWKKTPYSLHPEKSIQKIEMSFSSKCNFKDVYLIANLLKDYGLQCVFPFVNERKHQENEIIIGSYLHTLPRLNFEASVGSANIESFLLNDPELSTKEIIQLEFLNIVEFDDLNENFIHEKTNSSQFHIISEIDKETAAEQFNEESLDRKIGIFNALTDGQFGDYEDWDRDIGNLKDFLGH
jgi:hypothetical protein